MSAAHIQSVARPIEAELVARGRSVVHGATLALVWLAAASSGIVFAEPAPVDLMLMGLVVLLPLVGLVTFAPALVGYLAIWLLIAATGFLAAPFAADATRATSHTAVTLYLSIASVVLAAFVAVRPEAHARLILGGMVWAAAAATLAGLIGYFAVVPGASEMFTRFGRAAGTFKDPNVFGAFLVAPVLYCLALALERPLSRTLLPMSVAAVLGLGVLLSFSRGAWINLAIAVALFGFLSHATAATARARARITVLAAVSIAAMAAVALLALQVEKVADLVTERAALTQSYDVGPEGRFGGQEKALRLVAENPLGIGAQDFALTHHHEEAHNVYLSMALNAGWLGGGLFLVVNALTLVVGGAALLASVRLRPLMIVALSAYAATALEGIVIDTDHWRHLFIEMALVWGLAVGAQQDRLGPGDHARDDHWGART